MHFTLSCAINLCLHSGKTDVEFLAKFIIEDENKSWIIIEFDY